MEKLNNQEFYSKIMQYLKKNLYSVHWMREIKSVKIQDEDNEHGYKGENYVVRFERYNSWGFLVESTMLIPIEKFKRDMERPYVIIGLG